jgi:uncharacterized membrane protein (UPF0127 family)
MGESPLVLMNERTQDLVAGRVEMALSRRARRVGLLGRTELESATAMCLAPCFTIHTAFMRFPIDVVFLDRDGCAVRVIHRLKPWRAAMSARAYAVVELPAGSLEQHSVKVGDRLVLKDV